VAEQIVKRVVIAGGGTAGWSTAAALGKVLGSLLDVTLVESEDIGIIGVGESTVPTTRKFHSLLGIDEREFLRDNQGSIKLGISFENWKQRGERYIHSFGTVGRGTWVADFHHIWLEAVAQGFGGDLGDYCFELKAAEAHRFAASDQINYAYHLDAGLYARFLRRFSEQFGVKRVEGKIREVERDGESGFITALALESGERIEGDLFIDCTGFRSLLSGQALETGFEDWLHWLPNDTAFPIQTTTTAPIPPYTRAVAHEAGWLWAIPLQRRMGSGLVFSSAFMSDEQARERLHSLIDGEILLEPRPIRFRAGRRLGVWQKNCVAIGLAGGFVEPLESTTIHMIQVGVTRLIQMFPFDGFDPTLIKRYNDRARNEIEHIRDFIVLHYHQTERDDSPFWNHVRTMTIPDTLSERMALWRENAHAYQDQDQLFRIDSWVQVLLGQGLTPRGYHRVGQLMPPETLRRALTDLKTNIAGAVAKLPQHEAFLNNWCGERPA
jgi:tryptophan halogenase